MKKEIENIKDIKLLVNSFYEKVLKDPELQPFFTKTLLHWDEHLEIMYHFWDNILFFTGSYTGNPMEKHSALNSMKQLTPQHFDRWLLHFNNTIDELYFGEKANLAKQRAYSIAVVMKLKIIGEPAVSH